MAVLARSGERDHSASAAFVKSSYAIETALHLRSTPCQLNSLVLNSILSEQNDESDPC
jgi:hypothetical protein